MERNGNTFIASTRTNKSNLQQTQYTWKDSKNNEYPIYISASGSCYVIKTSKKTGKEYKSYLPKEVSATICKELNYKKMKVTREDNTFIRQDGRNGDKSFKTKYQFKDLDGTMYNIYISIRKNAFYRKKSKSGREYKITLPKEVTNAILEELKSDKDKVLEKEGGIK